MGVHSAVQGGNATPWAPIRLPAEVALDTSSLLDALPMLAALKPGDEAEARLRIGFLHTLSRTERGEIARDEWDVYFHWLPIGDLQRIRKALREGGWISFDEEQNVTSWTPKGHIYYQLLALMTSYENLDTIEESLPLFRALGNLRKDPGFAMRGIANQVWARVRDIDHSISAKSLPRIEEAARAIPRHQSLMEQAIDEARQNERHHDRHEDFLLLHRAVQAFDGTLSDLEGGTRSTMMFRLPLPQGIQLNYVMNLGPYRTILELAAVSRDSVKTTFHPTQHYQTHDIVDRCIRFINKDRPKEDTNWADVEEPEIIEKPEKRDDGPAEIFLAELEAIASRSSPEEVAIAELVAAPSNAERHLRAALLGLAGGKSKMDGLGGRFMSLPLDVEVEEGTEEVAATPGHRVSKGKVRRRQT